jgi:hypothetical protein
MREPRRDGRVAAIRARAGHPGPRWRYDPRSMGSPHTRLLWVRILIPLMVCVGVVSAIGGVWPTAIGMGFLIVAQVLVYRRAKQDIAAGE